MASQDDIIRSYLVELGFEIDNAALTKFKSAIDGLSQLVQSHTMGMAKAYVVAATEIVSALATVGVATASLFDKIAKADMGYQKYAMHMYMAGDAARQLKIVTDAMGESLEDIRWMPELHKRFGAHMTEAQGMEPPKDAKGQLEYIRDIKNEFTRLKIETTYGLQQVGYYLFKYLQEPIAGIKWGFKDFNDYLQTNLPIWAERIAYYWAEIILLFNSFLRLLKDIGKGIALVWDALGDETKAAAAVATLGLIFYFGGPITKGIMLFGAVLLAAQDFYNYMDGRDSVTGRIVNYFKEMGKGLEDFKLILDPIVLTLKGLGYVFLNLLRIPLLLIHGLLLGIKAILFGLNVVKAISMGGSAADVAKLSDAFLDNIRPHVEGVDSVFEKAAGDAESMKKNVVGYMDSFGGKDSEGLPTHAAEHDIKAMRALRGGAVPEAKEGKYDKLILAAAKKYKVNPALIKAIMQQESSFIPSKYNEDTGATGLMQVLPATAAEMAQRYKIKLSNLYDPEQNIELGAAYLSFIQGMTGRSDLDVASAYHSGPDNRAFKAGGRSQGPNNLDYVRKVSANYRLLTAQHFGEGAGVNVGTVTNYNQGDNITFTYSGNATLAEIEKAFNKFMRDKASKQLVAGKVRP